MSNQGPMDGPDALEGLNPADLLRQGAAEDTIFGNSPPFTPPSLEELSRIFPHFEILELIGQGGMGAVYKVRQRELDRLAALKILPPAIGEQAGFAERFTREARALAKLNHPGIVTLYEFGQADGLYFFLMELVDGANLRLLLRNGRIAPREAMAIVPQICDALQFAHDHGIVHRDIKPENILLDRRGRVKVADFGIAKLMGAEAEEGGADFHNNAPFLTEAGKVMGTPDYMAPEQTAHPNDVDHRADIYALGVVFYQMLTGELPDERIEAPSRKVRIDVRLDEVVLRALEKSPEHRYQHVSQVKTMVETIASTPGSSRREEAQTESGKEKTEMGQSVVTSAALQKEKLIIGIATVFFVAMFVMQLVIAEAYPRQATAPILLMAMCAVGMVVCGLRLAGLWPFPSLRFPRPNYSSRNLADGNTKASWKAPATGWPYFIGLICGVTFTSRKAWVLASLSALGFLGFWSFLSYLPFPAAHYFKAFSGFFGLFGLIGLALAFEFRARDRRKQAGAASSPSGGSRREEAHAENSESGNQKAEMEPRFSRTAIVGACWAMFVIFAVLMFSVRSLPVSPEQAPVWQSYSAPGWRFIVLMFTLLPLGITAPFGTTILGWVAVSQIRRSAGKLHGLWLAVFDGLVFPLLVLDGLLVYTAQAIVTELIKNGTLGEIGSPLAFVLTWGWPVLLVVDAAMIWLVWRAVNKPLEGASASAPATPHRTNRIVMATVIGSIALGVLGTTLLFKHNGPASSPASLADSPQELRKLPTAQVIEAGLAKPLSAWVWSELENRPLTAAEVAQIMDGLDAWLKREYPAGCSEPLSWLDNSLEHLNERHLLTDEQKIHFLTALHGDLRPESPARMREGEWQLTITGDCRWIWRPDFLGLEMMNAPLSVTVDGQPVRVENNFEKQWNIQHICETLFLSALPPGKHKVKLEFLSALVAKDDLAGLDSSAPSAEWPPAKKRWTRTAEVELTVYPRDAVIVSQTQDPALDPMRNNCVGVKSLIIRPKGNRAQAVLNFSLTDTQPVHYSFDVALRVGEQTVSCGQLWSAKLSNGRNSGRTEFTVELDRPAPEIREAEIILTPNPQAIEHIASVDRIWGGKIVFGHISLTRQDLSGAKPAEATPPRSENENAAVASAQTWLAEVDHGNYEQSWKEAAAFFQAAVTESGWESALNVYRKPLGEMKSRKLLGANEAESLPGAPDGKYVVMQFETSFAVKKTAVETVTFMREKDGTWKAAGYFIK